MAVNELAVLKIDTTSYSLVDYRISGISDSTSTTSSTQVASSTAVKAAYDLAASKTANIGTITSVTTTAGTHTTINISSGAVSFNVPTKTSHLTNDSGFITSYTDTKNTAGSTDTSSKLFLIGATSQAANPQTYTHDTAYVDTDGCLYSNGTKVSVEGHSHSYLPTTTKYAASSSVGGSASSLDGLTLSTTTNLGIDNTTVTQQIGYVNGLTKAAWNSQQTDGALYKQTYSNSWSHMIFGDYRTGHIAVRGRNNGSFTTWYNVLDSGNYTTWCTPANIGAAASNHTHDYSNTYAAKTHGHNYAGSSSDGGDATRAIKLKDYTNNNDTFLDYGAAALAASSVTYLGAWNGYRMGSIHKDNVCSLIGAATSGHTHNYAGSSSAGGDATNALKLNGYASDTAATANTIARRQGNGYLFATYYNQSSGTENPSSTGYLIFATSDGYFRKASQVYIDKNSYLTAPRVYNAVWNADYAEGFFYKGKKPEVGEIVELAGDGKVQLSTSYSSKTIGVVSDTYCLIGGADKELLEKGEMVAVGMLGKIKTKVTGKIKTGDRILAGNNGIGFTTPLWRSYEGCNVVGIAAEDNDDPGEKLVLCIIK